MTTIAYHHESKTVACDSRRTLDGIIITDNADKMRTKDGVIFWLSGSVSDFDLLISMYFDGESDITPDCIALAYDGEHLFYCGCCNSEFWKSPVNGDIAIGSGMSFALAAFDFGCDAAGAVEYAKTRNIYTGGEVKSFVLPWSGAKDEKGDLVTDDD